MKQLIVAVLAAMTLFAGDTLAQTRPADAPATAPQAAASAPEQLAQPAQAVTETMIANCVHDTLALPENAAFAASPRTQAVGTSLKLAPCAGGATVELRPVSRVDNANVHDSAWRQVADALQTRATAAAQPRAEAMASPPQAPTPAQTTPAQAEREDGSSTSFVFMLGITMGAILGGLIAGILVYLFMSQKRPKRRDLNSIGPGREVSPRQPPAVPDKEALPGHTYGHGQPEPSGAGADH